MVQINIKVDEHGLAAAFNKKAGDTKHHFDMFTKELVNIAQKWVQTETPRKTGKLKASIHKEHSGSTGYVWQNNGIAYYGKYVLDGTSPHKIYPKHKKALRVPGFGVFKFVRHPGTKSNPFFDKAFNKMQGDINTEVNAFTKWLGEV